jgi:hypothetical protein
MGNPQASVTDLEIGWILGVVDGEGHIGLSKGSRAGVYQPTVKFVNTNSRLIELLKTTLTKMFVPYSEYDSFRTGNQRPAKRIEINSFPNVYSFLSRIQGYDFAKREEALALRRYCGLRLSKKQGSPLSEEELALVDLVQTKSRRS